MTEEKKTEEITGWVAWHPEKGANINSFNDVSYETALLIHVDSELGGEDYGYDNPDESWAIAQNEGWRIRPVKVVFTDDGAEK